MVCSLWHLIRCSGFEVDQADQLAGPKKKQTRANRNKNKIIVTLQGLATNSALLLALTVFSGLLQAQAINPLENDPRAARAGGSLFRAQCATCHGADARGISTIDAPDLTLMWVQGSRNDSEVFTIIRDGIAGSIMPPHGFTDTEVWMLVSYLRSVAVTGTMEPIGGDVERGASLFAEQCARCHRLDGVGGSLGPDLSGITARRSIDALLNALREPSANIARRYKPVTLVTASGETVQGTIKSEDAFSIQIMDSEQALRAFMKADLRQLNKDVASLMPEFSAAILSDAEVNDVLSYLQAER